VQVLQGKAPNKIKQMPEAPQNQEPVTQVTEIAAPRGRGRPPAHRVEAGVPRPEAPKASGKTSFPRPTGGAVQKKFESFIKYWQSLTPSMLTRARIHVYRKWPVIDRVLSGEKNQSIEIFQDDPALGKQAKCHYDVDNWQPQVLHEFGSGDYKYLLNEIGVSGVIALCDFVSVRDIMFPPKLNPAEVVKGDKMNADYIQGARDRGIKFPGDTGFESEKDKENDVAQAQAETIDRLTDKLITMADRPQPTPAARNTPDENAASRSLEVMAKAMEIGGNYIKTSQEQAMSLQGKQVDPIQMLTTLGGVMKEIMPRPKEGADPMVAMLMAQAERAEARNDALQRELRDREDRKIKEEKEWRQREEERHARDEERRDREYKERLEREKPKTLLEQLKEKNEIDELMGTGKKRKSGGDEEDEEKKESTMDTILKYTPLVVSGLTTLVTLGANIVYNMRVKPGEQPQPVPTQAAAQVQAETMALASGQTVQQAAAAKQQQEQLNAFLQSIEGPFLAHFFGIDLNGYSFAEHIINSSVEGSMIYAQMKSGGKEALLQALSTYPPIWMKVGGMQPDLQKFADEFLGYQEWKQALDEEDDEEDDKTVDTKAVN